MRHYLYALGRAWPASAVLGTLALTASLLGVTRSLLADEEKLPAGRVWLTDLQETSAEVGQGKLGKNGHFSADQDDRISIGGKPSPHGIGAHANSKNLLHARQEI